MIEIKKGVLERIKNWDDESVYVLADFDRTITVGDSEGSWSILSKSDKVPDGYKKEAKEILLRSEKEIDLIKTSAIEQKNNKRILESDSLYGVLGPGDMVEIDACEADISLVSAIDSSIICLAGRATSSISSGTGISSIFPSTNFLASILITFM